MYLAHHELGSVDVMLSLYIFFIQKKQNIIHIFVYVNILFIIKLVACRCTRAYWHQLCLGAMWLMRQMEGTAQRSSGKIGPEDIHMSNDRFVLETRRFSHGLHMEQLWANDMYIVPNCRKFCTVANGIDIYEASTLQCNSLLQSMSAFLEKWHILSCQLKTAWVSM